MAGHPKGGARGGGRTLALCMAAAAAVAGLLLLALSRVPVPAPADSYLAERPLGASAEVAFQVDGMT